MAGGQFKWLRHDEAGLSIGQTATYTPQAKLTYRWAQGSTRSTTYHKRLGTKHTYIYSLKADYPISIGIIGDKGKPAINLANTSAIGDLYLTGDVTITNSNENGSISLHGYGLKEGRILNIGAL